MSGSVWMGALPATEGVLGRRVLAWVIDGIAIGAIWLALWCVLFVFGIITFGLGFFLLHGLWVVPLAYTVVFVASPLAATPGQAMLGVRLVRAEDGLRPNAAQAVAYAIGYWLTMAAGGGVLLLVALFTEGHRALHDIVAGIVVVRRDAGPLYDPTVAMGPIRK